MMYNQQNDSMFDLDMDVVRLERRVGVGGERFLDLVLKPRDHAIDLLLIMQGPDTIDFRKRSAHSSFRIRLPACGRVLFLGTDCLLRPASALRLSDRLTAYSQPGGVYMLNGGRERWRRAW
jgi:hypothetical protein